MSIVRRWNESVVSLDEILIQDAHKEFSLSMMTSFGADGDAADRQADFEQVRGASFENDPFVQSIREHIVAKSALCEQAISMLDGIGLTGRNQI